MEEKTIETVDLVSEDQVVENPATDDTDVTVETDERTDEKEKEILDTIAKITSIIDDLTSRLKSLEDEKAEREKLSSGFFKPVEGDRVDEIDDEYNTKKRQKIERRYF